MDWIRIDPNIQKEYEVIRNGNNISIVNKYDNTKFNIEINIDAIQTSNASDAIKDAWKVNVNIDSNGKLSLQ